MLFYFVLDSYVFFIFVVTFMMVVVAVAAFGGGDDNDDGGSKQPFVLIGFIPKLLRYFISFYFNCVHIYFVI